MSKLFRHFIPGDLVFITTVTHQREKLLIDNLDLWQSAIEKVQSKQPFDLIASVVLPEHIHMIIDPGSCHLSRLMQRIKLSFSFRYRQRKGLAKGKIWQSRFWDHIIRDQVDMNRHIDYIHYNPVKHAFVLDPVAWEASSIHKFMKNGSYTPDWGKIEGLKTVGDFGE